MIQAPRNSVLLLVLCASSQKAYTLISRSSLHKRAQRERPHASLHWFHTALALVVARNALSHAVPSASAGSVRKRSPLPNCQRGPTPPRALSQTTMSQGTDYVMPPDIATPIPISKFSWKARPSCRHHKELLKFGWIRVKIPTKGSGSLRVIR